MTRRVRFYDLQQLDETGMNRAWIRYPRKKTELEGRVYLLKVEGEKSLRQVAADAMKPAFGLPAMGVEAVVDEDLHRAGCLIPWHPHRGHLARVPWQEWATAENLRTLVKIGVFDGVIGNNDRVVSNVLVLPNGTLLPIDEGEQEKPGLRLWVKYRRQIRQLMATTLRDRQWLDEWVRTLRLPSDGLRPYYAERLRQLPAVVAATLQQIQALLFFVAISVCL